MKTIFCILFILACSYAAYNDQVRWDSKKRVGGLSNSYATIETDEIGWPARNILKNNHGRTGSVFGQGAAERFTGYEHHIPEHLRRHREPFRNEWDHYNWGRPGRPIHDWAENYKKGNSGSNAQPTTPLPDFGASTGSVPAGNMGGSSTATSGSSSAMPGATANTQTTGSTSSKVNSSSGQKNGGEAKEVTASPVSAPVKNIEEKAMPEDSN